MIDFKNISVVVQGPLHTSDDDPRGSKLTQRCLASVREFLPGATIILSTWEGSEYSGLDYDELVLSPDPGCSIHGYRKNGEPLTMNINRQIVCTANGLKKVKTNYAIKIRSDNVLTSSKFVSMWDKFGVRDKRWSLFKRRVLASNFFAFEYLQGKSVPFFPSDFFHFGLTEDLLALWDLPLFEDYQFRSELKGKRQHANYPFPQICVEQILWTGFIRKKMSLELKHKFGDGAEQKIFSDKILVNNLIILDNDLLGLSVPKRLEQSDGVPYSCYTHRRWEYLYRRYCDPTYLFPKKIRYGFQHRFVRTFMYLRQGMRKSIRLKLASRQYRMAR